MANDLNQCNFIGRLGKDPEIRYMADGKAVANFSIAIGSQWKDKQSGQKQESTEWVRASAFGKLAEIIGEYVEKGSQIFLSGKIQTRKWQDNEGKDRYTTEIVANSMQMLGGKGKSDESDPARHASGNKSQDNPTYSQNQGGAMPDDFSDEIPFLPYQRRTIC